MDTGMKSHKSLPPLVEGKIHGYLKLVIDEVIWSNRSPGEIKIFASWWGETESAEFRPADITKNIVRSEQDTTEIYVIRTSLSLFEEYVKNCECIELAIISEETNIVVGISKIADLLEIFEGKPCFKYVPMINDSGNKIGEIHVSMKLEHITKSPNMQLKTHNYENKQGVDNIKLSAVNSFKCPKDIVDDTYSACRKLKLEESEIYKSILKSRRMEFQEPLKKCNNEVTDKLVAQVVERAQKLRGAILRETHNEDILTFNDNSLNEGLQLEDEVKLCEYFLGKDMTPFDEQKALYTLRSTSPTPSLIHIASNSFKDYKNDKEEIISNNVSVEQEFSMEEISEEKLDSKSKETLLLDHVDCIRIFVESFKLSPAGYRRVKSSCLSHNDNTFLSATYFVQYDMTFDHNKETGKKSVKKSKPIRICSKMETKQVIYFNHGGIYGISKLKPYTEYFIKYKIFIQHFNKKSLTELGTGIMHINDIIKSENWSIAQRLIILNKGIKVGELSVIAELGSNSIHFGKQYIDGIMSSKENIPILEIQRSLSQERNNKRSRSATEAQSKTSSQMSSLSTKDVDFITADNHLLATKDSTWHKTENMDSKKVDAKDQENNVKDMVLLQGLIHIAEGKDLPELNTYLICRAFWKEDKSRSQICNNTKNPFYRFCQLVPLIHDTELLDRIKDNYIIIEVYYRNNNIDNLLGLAKLPVHQLYVAYRDPRVIPHLLLSKYPVVSVDGWVPVVDPVTGQSCGQLLALVALGTAEQIALLEISRGLRNINIPSQTINCSENVPESVKYPQNAQQSIKYTTYELQPHMETFSQNDAQFYVTDKTEREMRSINSKTQECQTDISTVKEFKFNIETEEETPTSEHSVLHTLVGRLTEVLNVNKTNVDQVAQTEISLDEKQHVDVEEHMCINGLNLNNSSDDSDSSSTRHNFHLPTETYRSVGVGAEYNEGIDHQPNIGYDNTTFDLPIAIHTEKKSTDSVHDQTMFRAVIEIECAMHLPKIEKTNETIEPSTYVSFQANKSDPSKHLNSYMITNIFPHSCNPKWNWKCDAKLPTELLLHDEKRLILKIWRIFDADTSTQINLERDIVIGFSAIDLSVLISGFPIVSGWFHIMDFTGKCNGQIKVSITPLDNLSLFGKPTSTLSTTRIPTCNALHLNWFPSHTSEMHSDDTERNNTNYAILTSAQEEDKSIHSENQFTDPVSHVGLEDVSMSFLSLSLKTKLTELDEITKRLELRLRDVTNTAFEDDFENEFDLNEPNSDNENNDYKNADSMMSATAANYTNKICQLPKSDKKLLHNRDIIENGNQIVSSGNEIRKRSSEPYISHNATVSYEQIKPGASTMSSYSKQSLSNDNCQIQHRSEHLMQNIKTLDNNFADYPERGTKTHINYLLDKLSLQFPPQSRSTTTIPIRKNTTGLSKNLPQDNSSQGSNKCSQELRVCTVPTQTDDLDQQNIPAFKGQLINRFTNGDDACINRNSPEVSAQSQVTNKMSTVIREELVAEENNDTSKCDELTTYLVASNIRHMDLNNIFSPLLYQHLVPDLHYSNTSPEEEAIEQLDNRYTKAFSTSIDTRLNKVQNLMEIDGSFPENAEQFRMTPSGVSGNIDDKIDLTVLHKSSYNDLLSSNSTESTATISPEKTSIKSIDTDTTENNYPTSSQTSVLVLSRQAPDGGNPIEDATKPLTGQQKDEAQDSSSSSSN
ncbi:C2 domain-containing protein 3-like [Hylaeus anthracinus]|uniref:C2 domain-containing protein 3-like n=1 Tax=Hylaeus anthracinus TaxID=313031 RepID=UPI0023B9A86D|nr:C2 domain-containing protein 3-like [Hylaeus anthracinus]